MSKEEKSGNWFKQHKVLTVVGVIILLSIIGGAAGGGNKSGSSTTNSSSASKTEPKTATKQPDVPAEYKSALSQAGTYGSKGPTS